MLSMKIIIPILISTSMLVACGGGSSTNANNDDIDPDIPNISKVGFPYGLDKSDGKLLPGAIASLTSSVRIVGGYQLPVPPDMVELVLPDDIDDPANPIFIDSYLIRKCQSGNVEYTKNFPPTPVRVGDSIDSYLANPIYQISANNCKLASEADFYGAGIVDGVMDRSLLISPFPIEANASETTLLTTSEYTNYIYASGQQDVDVTEFEKNAVYLTGSGSHTEIRYAENDAIEFIVDTPRSQYTTLSGESLVIDSIVYIGKGSKVDGFTTEALSFNAKWVMGDSDSGNKLIWQDEVSSLIFMPLEDVGTYTYPKGSYDLRVALNSPLFVPPGKILPAEGSITVNLISHNVKVDIVYHATYADVTYTRDGVIKRVQVDTGI